jgi:hypothetical protein
VSSLGQGGALVEQPGVHIAAADFARTWHEEALRTIPTWFSAGFFSQIKGEAQPTGATMVGHICLKAAFLLAAFVMLMTRKTARRQHELTFIRLLRV